MITCTGERRRLISCQNDLGGEFVEVTTCVTASVFRGACKTGREKVDHCPPTPSHGLIYLDIPTASQVQLSRLMLRRYWKKVFLTNPLQRAACKRADCVMCICHVIGHAWLN